MSGKKGDDPVFTTRLGSTMAIGVAVGVAMGIATGNVALWIGVGLAIGVAIGVAWSDEGKSDTGDEGDDTPPRD